MWLRKILLVAAVAAPLALSPADVFAQAKGAEQAGAVSNASGGPAVTELPAGIARQVDNGGVVPFGISRRYTPPVEEAPEPVFEPEPVLEPEPEEPCATWPAMQDGQFGVMDCHGNFYPL